MNALTHGQTCTELIFLPGESREQFAADVTRYAQQLGAVTEPEIDQVRTALYNELKRTRIEAAEVCAVNQEVDKMVDLFADTTQAAVRDQAAKLAAEPGNSVDKLRQSTAGCTHLLEQFEILQEWMSVFPSFEVSQREYALRLGGHDPRDLFLDPMVMELNRAYLGGIKGPGGFDAAGAANAFIYDKPADMSAIEFERRMLRVVVDLPTKADGRAILQRYVETNIAVLTERRELIALREERNLANAKGAARVTVTAEGDRRQRYAASCTRLSQAAYRLLFAMKKERREHGEGDLEELDSAATVNGDSHPAEGSSTADLGAGSRDCQNEPEPAQVVGGVEAESPLTAPRAPIVRRTVAWGSRPLSAPMAERPETGDSRPAEAPAGKAAARLQADSRDCQNEPEPAQVVGGVEAESSSPAAREPVVEREAVPADHPLAALIAEGRQEFADLRPFDPID